MTTEQTEIQIPEVERAAVAILAGATIHHPALQEWVKRLLADPAYAEHFDAETMRAIKNHRDSHYSAHRAPWVGEGFNRTDEALMWLAGALRLFREDGRPSGDTSHGIGYGFGVTSSLAAAIGECAARLQNAMWNTLTDLDELSVPAEA